MDVVSAPLDVVSGRLDDVVIKGSLAGSGSIEVVMDANHHPGSGPGSIEVVMDAALAGCGSIEVVMDASLAGCGSCEVVYSLDGAGSGSYAVEFDAAEPSKHRARRHKNSTQEVIV
jgi:hypothetical protein